MSHPKLPLEFVMANSDPSLDDIAWAFEKGLIAAPDVVKFAEKRAVAGDKDPKVELLATLPRDSKNVRAALEPNNALIIAPGADLSSALWQFLVLLFIYENRASFADPLAEVENVYADFDYPEDMREFVRYEPSRPDYEPQAHSYEENIDRLYKNWLDYLVAARAKFGPQHSSSERP